MLVLHSWLYLLCSVNSWVSWLEAGLHTSWIGEGISKLKHDRIPAARLASVVSMTPADLYSGS